MAISADLVERALSEIIKRRANYDYFFQHLNSPEWIKPLKARGLFVNPPPQEESEGGISAPDWPPSRYLARMANRAPQDVFDVMIAIETSNERIHEDFVDAALVLPTPLSRRLAEREIAWLGQHGRLYFGLSRKLVTLISRVVEDGNSNTALALMDELFRTTSAESSSAGFGTRVTAEKCSEWEYSSLLDQAIQVVGSSEPRGTLQYLVNTLRHVIELDSPDGSDDFSQIWRPRLEVDDRNGRDVLQALTSALRDAAKVVHEGTDVSDRELLHLLESGQTSIFRRVMAYVMLADTQADPAVLEEILLNRDDFFAPEPSHEYRQLLASHFSSLSQRAQNVILSWIEEGPDQPAYERRFDADAVQGAGDATTAAEEYVAHWRIRRLDLIRDGLPEEWNAEYSALVSRYGAAQFITSFEVTTWWGPQSPMSLDALGSLSNEDLINLLETYADQPSDWFGPSPEGLARVLGQLAEHDPERVSEMAPNVANIRPVYVQWILIGLTKALRDGGSIMWTSLIRLLQQVIELDDAIVEYQSDNTGQWSSVRREAASLLEAGFEAKSGAIPTALRESVWLVLSRLMQDPEPASEFETRYGGSNMDPVMLALNTTRGRAMYAVVAYALWVGRSQNSASPSGASSSGLGDMPEEVRDVLDWHLDSTNDSSVAVRAVYGQRFPWLATLDEQWAAKSAAAIFPNESESSALKEASWCAYIMYCQPYDSLLGLLRTHYEAAVERGDRPYMNWNWLGGGTSAPRERLAAHLVTFYLRGALSIGNGDQLLQRLFVLSSADVRASAIEFVGRGLQGRSNLQQDVRVRAERLWEWRLQQIDRSGQPSGEREAAAFSWWAGCEAIDPDWRLDQIEKILGLGDTLEPESVALEALGKLVHVRPARSVRALRTLLQVYREGWTIYAYREDIEHVLRTALASTDQEAASVAEDIVHWLGSLGFNEFRALLQPSTS